MVKTIMNKLKGDTMKEVAVKQTNKQVATLSQEDLVNEWGVPTTPSQDMIAPKRIAKFKVLACFLEILTSCAVASCTSAPSITDLIMLCCLA